MTPVDSAIGVDPGPRTGLCFIDYAGGQVVGHTLLQVDWRSARHVLGAVLANYYTETGPAGFMRRVASVEAWTEARSGSAGKPGTVTRQLVVELTEELQLFGYQVTIRKAADVKPWASDRRLEKVFGKESFHGDMNHAFDAARHCIYGARQAELCPDPLARRTVG